MQLVPATAAVTARVLCALWANSRHIQVTARALKAKAALDADTICVGYLAPYVNRRASVLGLPAAQIQQQRTGRRPFE